MVTKASGGWGPIIVLSALISSVVVPEFRTPRLPEVGPPEAVSCSQIPSAIVLASSMYMETFKHFVLFFWSIELMESILPPWFSDSIGSKVSLVTGLPFGLSQCRLAFGSSSSPGFWREFLCLFCCASELLSVAFWAVSIVFFFSLLMFERALFLVEPSDSFRSKGYLSDVPAPWDESLFHLVLLTRLDLRVTLATWSPFGTSLEFLTHSDLGVTLSTWSPFGMSLFHFALRLIWT